MITDPQVIKWSNERARTLSDRMAQLYTLLVAYQADYAAQAIAAKIVAAGATDQVGDGAAADGRPLATGTNLQNLKAAIDQLKTSFDTAVSGVGSPVTTIVNAIKVNG